MRCKGWGSCRGRGRAGRAKLRTAFCTVVALPRRGLELTRRFGRAGRSSATENKRKSRFHCKLLALVLLTAALDIGLAKPCAPAVAGCTFIVQPPPPPPNTHIMRLSRRHPLCPALASFLWSLVDLLKQPTGDNIS